MFVKERFTLNDYTVKLLKDMEPNFGYNGFGEFIFYRTYSRYIESEDRQENWADCVVRVISGCMSIRKDWYLKNNISWDEKHWQSYAKKMAISLFNMEWLAPGRGLWAMGTDFIYERGGMALNNCVSGDTLFITEEGLVAFEDVVNKDVVVMTKELKWRPAKVKCYGKQKLNLIIFDRYLSYKATSNHRWFLADGSETTELKIGDKVKIECVRNNVIPDHSPEYRNGYTHGLVYLNGESLGGNLFSINDQNKQVEKSTYLHNHLNTKYLLFSGVQNLKRVPLNLSSINYKSGFIEALIQAGKPHQYPVVWIYDNAPLLGYTVKRDFSLEQEEKIVEVENIIPMVSEQLVYCVEEPVTHSFMLSGGIVSGNCGFVDLGSHKKEDKFENDLAWLMDALMLGVGVGFSPIRNDKLKWKKPSREVYDFIIPDSREGWVESELRLIQSIRYGLPKPRQIYDEVRKAGLPIRGFGGISSGPEPLMELHEKTEELMFRYMEDPYYDTIMLKVDLANMMGVCTVAGNVRRSAELASASIKDPTFKNLKNYEDPKYAYRRAWGWMSNHATDLEDDEDFEMLGDIAKRVIIRGEPGYKNLQNFKYGRIGKRDKVKLDKARGLNPCQRGSSLVLTPGGIITVDKVEVGDKIWSNGEWARVERRWSTDINKVYKYTTIAGYFEGTADHRIVWQGHKVPVQHAPAIDIIRGPYKKVLEYDPQCMMDGLLVGDGSVQNDIILLIIGKDDQDYYQKDVNYLIKRQYNKSGWHKVQTTLDPQELPHTYLRRIPKRYLYADRVKVCSFLRGLFSANGDISGNKVALKANSFGLIQDVQVMLSSVGIQSYFTTNGHYLSNQLYDLNISVDVDKFRESIGFIQRYKIDSLSYITLGFDYSKSTYDIIDVEYLGEEETFDITVDNESHTYWTAGCNVSNCGESLLENKELCNQSETLPTVSNDPKIWLKSCEYATYYASTVSLLMTHVPETNRVIARNRRITVGIIDFSGWKHDIGVSKVTKWLREGYKIVRRTNKRNNAEAGVPEAIRVTTIKPGGTTPKLPGRTPGIGHPTFDYTLRRANIAKNSPIMSLIIEAEITFEESITDKYSNIIEWPILQGPAKPADSVSLWEQAMNLVLVQREWSDNAVSNTLYFQPKWLLKKLFSDIEDIKKYLSTHLRTHENYIRVLAKIEAELEEILIENYKIINDYVDEQYKIFKYNPQHEEDHIEPVLSAIAPLTKTVTLLPHTPKGVYAQMPEEGISKEEYEERLSTMKKIDWSKLKGSDGQDERYCQGNQCEMPVEK